MKHYIKYYSYKYLNKQHNMLTIYLLKVLLSIAMQLLIVPKHIRGVVIESVANDDFKLAFRRIAWLARHSWLRLSIVKDRYFDFSIGLTAKAALEAYKLVESSSKLTDFEREITLAQLSSAVLESQVLPNESKYIEELGYLDYDEKFLGHLRAAKKIEEQLSTEIRNSTKYTLPIKRREKNAAKSKKEAINLMSKHASEVFADLLTFFENKEARVFVISGTFLGLIREKGFLAHDYDIDFGIFESDFTNELLEGLKGLKDYKAPKVDYPCFRKSINGKVLYERASTPALVKLLHKTGVQVDLFTHYEELGLYWHGSSLHRWDNEKFELEEREFIGFSVWSPSDYDKYLTENYGNWRVPVKSFNCSTDTPNVVVSDSCKTQCYFLKREFYKSE